LTTDRWQRIKSVFQAAAELESSQRAAYLNDACAGAPELRREVEALLASSDEAGDFIEEPALHQNAGALAAVASDSAIGRRVGAYRVTGEIGSGGMGTVYKAVRADDHFRQEVAIKIVKRGMDTDYIVRRFRNERQILASLEHPNIARLFDGGATEEGLPYYVMEFIEGRPIDEYCDAQRLSTAERLSLFITVSAAVNYAHQKMVVHRDIKPSNILITSEGVPKLLDFGIAKILDPEMSTQTIELNATETALRMMTPAYASPEQIRGEAITPASDVYSLGVLLYELLTGHRPYRFKSRAPHDMAQVICEEEPEKPSAAVARTEEITVTGPAGATRVTLTPELVSRTRDGEPKKLRQCLEGDLDSVVLKAMRKEADRRYESAQAFSDDIRRYLDGRPVAARSGAVTYRFGKWVARRKTSVAAAAALIVALAGAAGLQFRVTRTPAPARVKMRPSVAVMGFKNLSGRPQSAWLSTALTEMLSTELAAGERLRAISGETVEQVKIQLSLSDNESFGRETLTRIRSTLGADYIVLGSYLATGAAGQPIRLDLRLQDAVAGETVIADTETGRESDLAELVARAGARVRERLGAGEVSGTEAVRTHATAPAGAEAAKFYSEGLHRLRIFDTVAAKDYLERAAAADPKHAFTHSALALALSSLGDDARATQEAKKAFDLSKDLPREMRLFVEGRYYETTNSWDKAGNIYHALYGFFPDNLDYGLRLVAARSNAGSGREALRLVDELRRLPAPDGDDPRIDVEEASAAEIIGEYQRELAAAARAAEKGTAQRSRILVARAKLLEGRAYASLGQPEKAIASLEESEGIYRQFGHRRGAARALNGLAFVKLQRGDTEGARKLHEESLAIFREIGNQSGIAASLDSIAMIREQQGQFDAAKEMYRGAISIRREIGDRGALSSTLDGLATALLDSGSATESKKIEIEALTIDRELGDKRTIARDQSRIALATRFEGDLAGARSMYQEAMAICRQNGDMAGLSTALNGLSRVLRDQGDLPGAKRTSQEAVAIDRKQGSKRALSNSLAQSALLAQAEDDLAIAKALQTESLALRSQIVNRNLEAQTRLILAQASLEEKHPETAEGLAAQAAAVFREQKVVHQEASAEAVRALSLVMQKKFPEAQRAAARSAALWPKIEFRQTRLATATTLARVDGAMGKRTEAMKNLEALLAEATQIGLLPYQFDIRLALGELEIQSGDSAKGRARLAALRGDAAAKGFRLVARKAAEAAVK
jgi:serine/threonine protein kinase/tetratricopeptide (TPR) repeat protein/TolB-like protein